ncbi:MAG: hypothetical protein ACI8RD_000633, partial [Bacillariaceae sp.]
MHNFTNFKKSKNIEQGIYSTIDVVFCFRIRLGREGLFDARIFLAQEQMQ